MFSSVSLIFFAVLLWSCILHIITKLKKEVSMSCLCPSFFLQACSENPFKKNFGASLVVQWLRLCLLMQGTRVGALVWEDPACRRATRPVSHNY